jgi:hypothetical protein
MSIKRYYTVGVVARDVGSLKALDGRLEALGVPEDSLIVLSRRRDALLVSAIVPEARAQKLESSLTRMQWIEFASTYLGVTAVSVLMGAVHLPTGIAVQTIMTLAAIVGLGIYHRSPQLKKKLLRMALPDELAEEWTRSFASGFALVLATVPEELFDEAQDVFLEDERLVSPLAIDRRPVL